MFAAEVRMYENMLRSAARTLDAEAADFFYVPVLSSCKYLPKVRAPHHHPALAERAHTRMRVADRTGDVFPPSFPTFPVSLSQPYFGVDPWFGEKQINRAIGYIQRWPYWARTQGQDHIFTITYDYGACFEYKEDKADARGVNRHLFAPIILSSLGYARTRCFQPWKDIVVPTVSSDPLLWREARGGDSPLTLGLPGHEDDAEQYATARASLDAALRRIRARGWAVAQGGGGVWGEPGHDAALRGGGLRAPAPSATTRTPLAVHVHGSATPGARETDEFALPDWMVGAGIGGDTVLTAALGNETGLLRRLGTTWQPDAFGGRDTFLHFQGTFEWFDKDPDYSKGVRQVRSTHTHTHIHSFPLCLDPPPHAAVCPARTDAQAAASRGPATAHARGQVGDVRQRPAALRFLCLPPRCVCRCLCSPCRPLERRVPYTPVLQASPPGRRASTRRS